MVFIIQLCLFILLPNAPVEMCQGANELNMDTRITIGFGH
jgi:hypothetical protein